MKRLRIDWHALEMVFDDRPGEFGVERTSYLDLESGEVVFVDEDVSSTVDCIIKELDEVFDEDAEWSEEHIRQTETFHQLSEFEQSCVVAAINVEYGDAARFGKIPQIDSHEAYGFMLDFMATVGDDTMRSRLSEAIDQRKPFRRFRDVLAGNQRLERRWHQFEATRQREMIIEWLHGIGVEPANPEGKAYDPPPLPDLRNIMFAEVRWFVRLAHDIQGVKRIALIGSLVTEKEFPKDIDLLVTVSDDCDLAPLAKLGRQLSGHMNTHRAGADVFLAREDGSYIGRTCPWKHCGPGYRATCDAMHCGKRPYLHDDFSAIRLKEKAIAWPSVVLWPDLAAADVPRDVYEQLIERLIQDVAI